MDLKHLGILVKAKRLKLGLTLEKLAEQIGSTKSYLSRIENKGIAPSIKVVDDLSKVLGLKPFLSIHFKYDEDNWKRDKKDELTPIRKMLFKHDRRQLHTSVLNNLAFNMLNEYAHIKQKENQHQENHRQFIVELLLKTDPNKLKDDEALKKYNDVINKIVKTSKESRLLMDNVYRDISNLVEQIHPPLKRFEGDLTEEDILKALAKEQKKSKKP
jgi:transcriptional regulator with XRE-family HTH domain